MITEPEMIPLLLEACPSFRPIWDDYVRRESGDPLTYIALGHFARHLLELHRRHETEAFPAVAEAIERLHVEGDHFVREAATIGVLEGVQNVWGNNGVDPEAFFPYLLPESARWWRSLNEFWNGKSKFVGEGL